MQKELDQVKFDIHKLETMIEVLAKDIQDIKEALLGNEFGQEGLVKKVSQNSEQIADLVKFKQKIIAWATGAGLGSKGVETCTYHITNCRRKKQSRTSVARRTRHLALAKPIYRQSAQSNRCRRMESN
jgi:hypothetical protein